MRSADEAAHADLEDSYLEFDGARLRYRDEGQGPAVILVHGWTLDLDMWEPQVALTAGHRIIRLDRRGFGLSSGRPSLARDVTDLAALCRHLGLRKVALVGMSQGARVVVHLASVAPAMLSCLVLDGPPRIATGQGGDDSEDLPYQDYCVLARTQGLSAFRREWSVNPLVRLNTDDSHARDLLARMIARYPGKDLTDCTPRPALVTTLPMIASIQAPVLVIGGALDLATRKRFADEFLLQLPHAERAEIPDAGHLCNLDNPPAYNAALRRFLDRCTTAPYPH